MKRVLFASAIVSLFFSCKEVPVQYDQSVRGSDTTYMAAVESKQSKLFLVEEISGVKCVNCPAGTAQLNSLNSAGAFMDKLAIVSIHSGSLTSPITAAGFESLQDFRTEEGHQILQGIFGGEPGKPCAGFDRLPIAVSGTLAGKILDFRGNWETMLNKANEINGTPPVNVHISSEDLGDNSYQIKIKVSYTEDVSAKQALTVYITENNISDFQEFPSGYQPYVFNHIFRKVVTPWNGMAFLQDMDTKEAGRVFEQSLTFTIDPADPQQSFWKPENMDIIAFVHNIEETDIKILQSAVSPLK